MTNEKILEILKELYREHRDRGEWSAGNYEELEKASAIEEAINLIQKLQEENNKYKYLYQKALDNTIKSDRENIRKDNIIDEISQNPFNELRVDGIRFCGTDIKQYFKKVSDGDE